MVQYSKNWWLGSHVSSCDRYRPFQETATGSFSTVLQKENALFILNSSSHVLFATNRFEPNCEPNLGEVLNLESIHCS